MTTAEKRALATLVSFLIGQPDQLVSYDSDIEPESERMARIALEYLVSRCTNDSGITLHQPSELRDKWNARFGQVEGEEVRSE